MTKPNKYVEFHATQKKCEKKVVRDKAFGLPANEYPSPIKRVQHHSLDVILILYGEFILFNSTKNMFLKFW